MKTCKPSDIAANQEPELSEESKLSDNYESIHKISDVCSGEESIRVDQFPKKTKEIIRNILKNNPWLISDYSSIDLRGEKHDPEIVSRQFSDNIMLVYFVKHSQTRLSGSVRVLQSGITGFLRSNIVHHFSRLQVGQKKISIQNPVNIGQLIGRDVQITQARQDNHIVKRILDENDVFEINLDELVYKVLIKVSLSHKTLTDHVYSILKVGCDALEQQLIFLHDIDYTLDISGTFSKKEFAKYLTTNEGFSFDQVNSTRQIVKNDAKVSQWCLTFYDIDNVFHKKVKGKFYGKTICQMTKGKLVDNKLTSTSMHYFIKPSN